jgi:hypothetical protein
VGRLTTQALVRVGRVMPRVPGITRPIVLVSGQQQVILRGVDAESTAQKRFPIPTSGQYAIDLEGHAAWSSSEVIGAIAKCERSHECVAIVSFHVTKPTNTLMSNRPSSSTIKSNSS